mgnify:FL=1
MPASGTYILTIFLLALLYIAGGIGALLVGVLLAAVVFLGTAQAGLKEGDK